MVKNKPKQATDDQFRAVMQWLDPNWAGKWPLMFDPIPLPSGDLERIQARLDGLASINHIGEPHEATEWFEGDLMYPQIEAIKKALAHIPDAQRIEREEAVRALKTIYATIEVQGARIIQLNSMVPLDEIGRPKYRRGFKS